MELKNPGTAHFIREKLTAMKQKEKLKKLFEMIDGAKEAGLWLHSLYGDHWFSPEDFEKRITQDIFLDELPAYLWTPQDPRLRVDVLRWKAKKYSEMADKFEKQIK